MHAQSSRGTRLELVVIQPTPFCNLNCDYCYLPEKQHRDRIKFEVLERVFQRVFECTATGDQFTVVWHAGEPMVLPPTFYRKAIEIIERCNVRKVRVSHSFQTNATLVTQEWCEFIRETDLRIGVSIDGPDFLHDRHRKTRSGRATLSQALKGVRLLQGQQISFHNIAVLTRESLDYPDEIFEFFLENGLRRLAFNIEEIEGPHLDSSLAGNDAEERFREFLSRFFDLVEASGEKFAIREFDSALAALRSEGIGDRQGQQISPLGIINIDHRGNFGTFSPELLGLSHERYGSFAFGNVVTDSFDSMLGRTRFETVLGDIVSGVERCRETCKYFRWCGGGAPVNKLFENGTFDSTETMFCRLSRKAVVDVVLAKLAPASSTSVS